MWDRNRRRTFFGLAKNKPALPLATDMDLKAPNMDYGRDLPLEIAVDEASTLPLVDSIEALMSKNASCYCELLAVDDSADPSYGHTMLGEIDPPPWYHQPVILVPVHLFKVFNVFFFPKYGVLITKAGKVMRLPFEEARYITPDLLKLEGVEVGPDGISHFDTGRAIQMLDKAIVSMPWGSTNYGHFLLDCMPAAAIIAEQSALQDYPFVVPPLSSWQARHWHLLGLTPKTLDQEVYFIREALYTTGMHHFLHHPHVNYRTVRNRQCTRLEVTGRDGPQKIYLSRGSFPNRILESEDALVNSLMEEGFEVFDPISKSVDEQIVAFQSAKIIVGCSGAGFANVLYCTPGTTIVEIQPAGMENLWVRKLAFISRCNFISYQCAALAADPARPEVGLRFDLNVPAFVEAISNC